jgi:hypothetical protein
MWDTFALISSLARLYFRTTVVDRSLYRRPLPQLPGKPIRFSNQKIGVNKLKTFMKTICEKGGLTGHYTNHSGKRTCATQLYNQNVDEL